MAAEALVQQQQGRSVTIEAPERPAPPGALPLASGDRGPDVSGYQPGVDWAQVAASGCRFAFVKATEGTGYVNPSFHRDWQGIAAVGLVRGAYHFARPSQSSPAAEAAYFAQIVGTFGPNDIPVLDSEDPNIGGDLSGWTIAFLKSVEAATGRPCWLYSGPWYMGPHNLEQSAVADAAGGLWLAAYQGSTPAVPRGWEQHGIGFWQYTDHASIPGVPGPCDESIYRPA